MKFAIIEIFIMTDQPVNCPLCRARADIIVEFEMVNLLFSNVDCHFIFIEQEDDFIEPINYHEH